MEPMYMIVEGIINDLSDVAELPFKSAILNMKGPIIVSPLARVT